MAVCPSASAASEHEPTFEPTSSSVSWRPRSADSRNSLSSPSGQTSWPPERWRAIASLGSARASTRRRPPSTGHKEYKGRPEPLSATSAGMAVRCAAITGSQPPECTPAHSSRPLPTLPSSGAQPGGCTPVAGPSRMRAGKAVKPVRKRSRSRCGRVAIASRRASNGIGAPKLSLRYNPTSVVAASKFAATVAAVAVTPAANNRSASFPLSPPFPTPADACSSFSAPTDTQPR